VRVSIASPRVLPSPNGRKVGRRATAERRAAEVLPRQMTELETRLQDQIDLLVKTVAGVFTSLADTHIPALEEMQKRLDELTDLFAKQAVANARIEAEHDRIERELETRPLPPSASTNKAEAMCDDVAALGQAVSNVCGNSPVILIAAPSQSVSLRLRLPAPHRRGASHGQKRTRSPATIRS
jgi:hypothetical protein